jgi:non-specific serine/threonine protein kinase/serine/threonine-protein kinase
VGTPEQWSRIKEVVGAALERGPEERNAFLDQACSQNAALRAEVDSLLAAHAEADALFVSEHPDANPISCVAGAPRSIGPYQLIRELGAGGMGQVWLAEQTEPVHRRIALKLIKAGMYDQAAVQRFRAERQSLAIMEHPAIAKVFDAGSTMEGQPYLAMEYVDGLPITDYCDQKRLAIRERLKLFLQVCDGVQHAHQKAIIHRDLKPSNILVVEVNGKPMARIIDFGLAKAATPTTAGQSFFTRAGTFLGTPGYMSPEQADPESIDVDTRADVYSLGVVLYELLTGLLPFDTTQWKTQNLEEILRQLRETDPPCPSIKVRLDRDTSNARAGARGSELPVLSTMLKGDLDWVTMKALEKDRERRYGTVAELEADIENYLENRPVAARPASSGYRLRKYVRRHQVGVGVTAGVFVLLAAFAATEAVQLRRTAHERDRADRITDFMKSMFEVSDPGEARGNTITAREILDKASGNISAGLAKDPEAQAQMMEVMGEVYDSLGLYRRAEALFTQAVETQRRVLGPSAVETLKSMRYLAWVLHEEGRDSDAEKLDRDALARYRHALGAEHHGTLAAMSDLASILWAQFRYEEAETLQRETFEIQSRVLGPENEDTLTSMNNLANTLSYERKYAEAEALRRKALDVQRRVLGREYPDTLRSMTNLADTLYLEGHYSDAENMERETLGIQKRVLGPEHPETLMTMYNLSCALNKTGSYSEAETLGRKTLEDRSRVLGPEHRATLKTMVSLAVTLLKQGRYPEAEKLLRDALAIQRRTLGPKHPDVAASLYQLAILDEQQGKNDEAIALLRDSLNHGLPADVSNGVGTDPDLNLLHGNPRFNTLVSEIENQNARLGRRAN